MPVPTKPTTSHRQPQRHRESLPADSLSAAYAEIAADSAREAEARQWLDAISADKSQDKG